MPVSRIDIDGKGAGSPAGIVTLILKAEQFTAPIPIEKLCLQLDITTIEKLETEGFEGGLITDSERSSGIILVNENSHPYRRRFTIAHELGHFLIPTHMPGYHEERLAFVVFRNGVVLYATKALKFPFIIARSGSKIPEGSRFHRKAEVGVVSDVSECIPDLWIDVERGRLAPALYEQVLHQKDGHALIMLWLEPPDEGDEEADDDRTAKLRYRDRMAQYHR